MKRLVILLTLLGFGLAGCGGSNSGVSEAPVDNTGKSSINHSLPSQIEQHQLHTNDENYNWFIVNVSMPSGRMLVCLRTDAKDDYPISISCNWEDYNRRIQ